MVIANLVVDEAKKQKKLTFIFKVDFEKAYDNVRWSFLYYIMRVNNSFAFVCDCCLSILLLENGKRIIHSHYIKVVSF